MSFARPSLALRARLSAPRQPVAAFKRAASSESSSSVEKAKAAAGPALERAQKALGGVGEKGQQLLKSAGATAEGALGAYREPIFHNAAVAREVLKQVYISESLAPPSFAQVSSTYSSFFRRSAPDFSFWKQLYESGEWKRWAVYAVEAYGIFKIGEMVGRRHIVGYKLNENKLKAVV